MTLIADINTAINTNSTAPLYRQLKEAIRQSIESDAHATTQALPPEREIAQELSISRITVRKAIDGLVEEGLLTRRQGAGTFVVGRVEKSFANLSSFTEDMVSRGRQPRSEWLRRESGLVTPEESLMLGLSPGTSVHRFHRIRYADDVPMALEYTTIPAGCLPSQQAVGTSLYEALDKNGNRPIRALQRLRAVLFTQEQAALLDIAPGDPGLLIERRGFTATHQPVERTQSYYRGDAYDFVAELSLRN